MAQPVLCRQCQQVIPPSLLVKGGEIQCPGCLARMRVKVRPKAAPAAATPDPEADPSADDLYGLADPDPVPAPARPAASAGAGADAVRSLGPRRTGPAQAKEGPAAKRPRGEAGDKGKNKKVSGEEEASGISTPVMIGGVVVGVAVLIGIGYSLVSSARNPADGEPPPRKSTGAEAVVIDAPLPGIEPVDLKVKVAGTPPEIKPMPFSATSPLFPVESAADDVAAVTIPWAGKPDPPTGDATPIPANAFFYCQLNPVLSVNGLYGLWYVRDRSGLSPKPGLGDDDPVAERSTIPVSDLRTGKHVGRLPWNAPVARGARLSPDGLYLVGPDWLPGSPATTRDGTLFVYKRQAAEPTARFKVPGSVSWIEFVAPDRVAVLTFGGAPVLQVWDVARGEKVQEVPLPGSGLVEPGRVGDASGGRDVAAACNYAPSPWTGAVAPGGHLVALGAPTGPIVVDVVGGKVVGSLRIPGKLGAGVRLGTKDYRGVGFAFNGSELHALVMTPQSPCVVSWSMSTGGATRAVTLGSPLFRGAPVEGPAPDTLILPYRDYHQAGLPNAELHGLPLSAGAVIDGRTGAFVSDLKFVPLKPAGRGRFFVVDKLSAVPQVPTPPWSVLGATNSPPGAADEPRPARERPKGTSKSRRPGRPGASKAEDAAPREEKRSGPPIDPVREANLRAIWSAVHVVEVKAGDVAARAGGPLSSEPRPPAASGDRAGVAPRRPEPPASWSRPPAPPAPPEGLKPIVDVPPTRPLFGGTFVAFLNGQARPIEIPARPGAGPPIIPSTLLNQYLVGEGIYAHRYDLRTGKEAGEPIQLWAWATDPQRGRSFDLSKEPFAAALSSDGKRVALRDPADPARVDVWDDAGTHLVGLLPYGETTPIQYLGWSPGGRLLTLGGGKLTGWEVPAGKAAFEVDGGYNLPVAEPRGRAWLAVAAADHVDLLGAEEGACLGRLALAGDPMPRELADLAIAADGSLLAYLGRPVDPKAPPGSGALQAWDLSTGKAFAPIPVSPRFPGGTVTVLDSRRVLLGSSVYDVSLGLHFANGGGRASSPLKGSPDGQLWTLGAEPFTVGGRAGEYFGQEIPGEKPGSGRTTLRPAQIIDFDKGPPSLASIFRADTPVAVSADLGDPARSRKLAEAQVTSFQKSGRAIGRDGWKLNATYEVVPTEETLLIKPFIPFKVPSVVVHWKLLAPDGTEIFKQDKAIPWSDRSKFFTGARETGRTQGMMKEVIVSYNFGEKGPYPAILETLMEAAAGAVAEPPVPYGPVRGKYQILPADLPGIYTPVPRPAP